MKYSIRHYVFKLKWVLAIVVFVISIGFVGENCLMKRWEQKREISKLKSEIDEQNRKFEHDRTTLERLKNDPDAISEVAREKYLMKTQSEDLYVIEDEE